MIEIPVTQDDIDKGVPDYIKPESCVIARALMSSISLMQPCGSSPTLYATPSMRSNGGRLPALSASTSKR